MVKFCLIQISCYNLPSVFDEWSNSVFCNVQDQFIWSKLTYVNLHIASGKIINLLQNWIGIEQTLIWSNKYFLHKMSLWVYNYPLCSQWFTVKQLDRQSIKGNRMLEFNENLSHICIMGFTGTRNVLVTHYETIPLLPTLSGTNTYLKEWLTLWANVCFILPCQM